MGRNYAGVLGCLAFATVTLHGALHHGGVEATIWRAAVSMAAFALVGGLIGRIAQGIVEESVRSNMAEKLAARAAEGKMGPSPSAAKT